MEGLCAGRTPLEDWEAEYEQKLSLVDTRWDASGAWPRWSCLAVHFASFYLDVGLTRELGSVAVGGASEEETEMFRRLARAVGDATRDIVAALITHTEAPRDSSGSLLVGNAREGARLTKVRGCSEVAILRRRPFDGPDGWL